MICLNLPETLFRVASSLLIDMLFILILKSNKSTHKISVMKLLFCNFVENFNRLAQKISHYIAVRVMQQLVFDHTKSTCRRVQHGRFYSIKQKRRVFTFCLSLIQLFHCARLGSFYILAHKSHLSSIKDHRLLKIFGQYASVIRSTLIRY